MVSLPLITYCPLCGTGVVFDPIVNDKVSEFGTSGKLWNSNLVMYDRQTDSYWSQVLGEAIVGEMTGSKLNLLPHSNILYKDWKAQYPNGEVLSTDTGHSRDYANSPYQGYETSERIIFPVDYEDDRYHEKALTYQIEVDGVVKIYPFEELEKSSASFVDQLGDIDVLVEYNKSDKTIEFTRKDNNVEVVPFYGFWFSVIAVHPDAEVYIFGKK